MSPRRTCVRAAATTRWTDPANQAVERIAHARARRWDRPISTAKKNTAAIRSHGREAILAALGNLDPTWVRHDAQTLDQAVEASEPDRAHTRLQQAAADLRQSSTERAKLAADLQAASPKNASAGSTNKTPPPNRSGATRNASNHPADPTPKTNPDGEPTRHHPTVVEVDVRIEFHAVA